MFISKSERKKFDWTTGYIKDELKTDRHIAACLGSAGLTFVSDINKFKDYLKEKEELSLITIIENDRSLTEKELEVLK